MSLILNRRLTIKISISAIFLLILFINESSEYSNAYNPYNPFKNYNHYQFNPINPWEFWMTSGMHFMPNHYLPNRNKQEEKCACNLKGGKCEKNVCVCKEGFYGDTCEYSECTSNLPQFHQCNKGICLMHTNRTNDFKCLCDANTEGPLCDVQVCDNFCYNNGQCKYSPGEYNNKTKSYTKIAPNITCECPSKRFTGERCEFDRCYMDLKEKKCPSNCTLDSSCKCLCNEECDNFLCHNEGKCHLDNDLLTCKCTPGYSGPTCLTDLCSNYCPIGVACIRTNTTFYCDQSAEHLEDINSKIESYSASLFKFESNTLKIIVYTVPAILLICLVCVILYIAIRKTNNAASRNNVENPDFYAKNHSSYKREDEQSLVNQEEILNV